MLAMSFYDALEEAGVDIGFFLNNYVYQRERTMDASVPGLVTNKELKVKTQKDDTVYTYFLIPAIWGGVNMEMSIGKDRFTHDGRLQKVRNSIMMSRPRKDSLTWAFEIY